MSSVAEDVASIIVDRQNADFIRALMAAAEHFLDPAFEGEVAERLRTRPDLVAAWATYSADQRWTPAAYVAGSEAGWYDAGYQGVVQHPDEAAAVADFIDRTADYLCANRVEIPMEPPRDR